MRSSYYGQPVIKEPVWTWEIPCYFWTGGVAGASAGIAYLAHLRGEKALARRAWLNALWSVGASPALLILDLGKPLRFFNMLRVAKVTSPMSIGSWILTGAGTATGLAALNAWTGAVPRPAAVARPGAALLGLPLSTYTAALIANTAVPVWHEARHELPFVFGASAAGSAGATLAVTGGTADTPLTRRLAVGGAVAELAATWVMERRLGELGEPYRRGLPGRLTKAAKALTAVGAIAAAAGSSRRSSPTVRVGAGLIAAGTLAARWAIFKAGFASAADPGFTVGPQRERIHRGERAGAARGQPRRAVLDGATGSPATADVPLP
jgi:hypothetical protein